MTACALPSWRGMHQEIGHSVQLLAACHAFGYYANAGLERAAGAAAANITRQSGVKMSRSSL